MLIIFSAMLRKIRTVYAQCGLGGLLLRGTRWSLSCCGTLLMHAAGSVPVPGAYLSKNERHILERNRLLKDKHEGQRCFIIGNGPSLSGQDLTPLADEITIVMNRFNQHPIIKKWQPTFFCMADPGENIKLIGLSPFLEKIEAQAYFFQISVKEILDKHEYIDRAKVHYLKLAAGQLANSSVCEHSLDLTRAIPWFWNTAQMSIIIALYMGCSPIYLIGLDHDSLAHPSDRWAHFYQGPPEKIDLDKYNYKYRMEVALSTWKGYEVLRDIAIQKGIIIYNATAGGFLDVFPWVQFESLF